MIKLFIQKAYDTLEDFWGARTERYDQIMVRIVDLYGHSCRYCLAWRSIVVGAGIALLPYNPWASLAFLAPMIVLVLVERFICNIGPHDDD